jgi:hypothetical protein
VLKFIEIYKMTKRKATAAAASKPSNDNKK